MGSQTGPYREAETIEEEDIRRITGVLYGGKTPATGFEGNADRTCDSCDGHRMCSITACLTRRLVFSYPDRFDVDDLLAVHGQESRSVQEGSGRDRQSHRKRQADRLRRQGLAAVFRRCIEGSFEVGLGSLVILGTSKFAPFDPAFGS